MSSGKLRILCLHGYTQNAIMFRKKTGAARKGIEKVAETVYVTAPHYISPPTLSNIDDRQEAAKEEVSEEHMPYGWWFSPRYKPLQDGYFVGFKESIEFIKDILIKEGPFDGILGFSQGACFAALLTQMLEDRTLFPDLISPTFEHPKFKFAALVAGFNPKLQDATVNTLLASSGVVKTPSLHIVGELDTLVLPEAMLDLADKFEKPKVFKHAGGHYLPTTAASRRELTDFISKFSKQENCLYQT